MSFWSAVMPLLETVPPEAAHRLAIRLLAMGLPMGRPAPDDRRLIQRLFGHEFPNPVGLAAGFDKDAEAFAGVLGLGFGFVEVGSITPRPQPGNPRPRLFRLRRQGALINRLGFNSAGLAAAAARLGRRPPPGDPRRGIVGVNLGKNRDSAEAAADYALGARALAPHADYLVLNVSSPNTPGLRELQQPEPLRRIVAATRAARDAGVAAAGGGTPPPLLLKISPDLTAEDRAAVAEVALAEGLDGLIVGNTTVTRPPNLTGHHAGEAGGLSGRPLFRLSTEVLSDLYRLTAGRIPLVGVGGIASGADAYAKIRAGASLVQLYTGLVFEGPGLVRRLKRDLLGCLEADRFDSLGEAVGADHRPVVSPHC
jgi:dihydroorotate dehydrogenase